MHRMGKALGLTPRPSERNPVPPVHPVKARADARPPATSGHDRHVGVDALRLDQVLGVLSFSVRPRLHRAPYSTRQSSGDSPAASVT